MSHYVLDPAIDDQVQETPHRRQHHTCGDMLVLSEMHPDAVVDHLDGEAAAIDLITFGTVRETCPKCRATHLKLVLRQRQVRLAHLFCPECQGCFDARYTNGASALTI